MCRAGRRSIELSVLRETYSVRISTKRQSGETSVHSNRAPREEKNERDRTIERNIFRKQSIRAKAHFIPVTDLRGTLLRKNGKKRQQETVHSDGPRRSTVDHLVASYRYGPLVLQGERSSQSTVTTAQRENESDDARHDDDA
ncbi:hypothetical protein QLX08_010821 [Tetragonisca angustula]|uniref:Uncharacterized protein n=1 Tax=Tetragonisca angustula TaxID=166442 RepID=A0AAW0ZB40_9HYME